VTAGGFREHGSEDSIGGVSTGAVLWRRGREMKDFVEFIRKQGVVGLAIGFIIGAATGALVSSLVKNLVNPIIAAIFGKPDLSSMTFTIHNAVFNYGTFINALIDFVLILLVVYLIFKVLRLEKLDLEEEEEKKA
jgi:large conductance mechanosensitive channel